MRMLRFLVFTVVLVLLTTTAMAAAIGGETWHKPPDQLRTIKLILPKSSTNLELGKDAAVAWSYSGYPDTATVRLILVKNGATVGEIANNIPIKYSSSPSGTGVLPSKWKVGSYLGGNANLGDGYKIRILVNGFLGQDESDSTFSIVAPGPTPTLELTTPAGGENWITGKTVKISWNSTGITSPLRIVLSKSGVDVGTIAKPNAIDSSFEWNVGKLLPPDDKKALAGTDYRVRIETLTRSFIDESKNTFTITPVSKITMSKPAEFQAVLAPKTIKVTGPPAGTTFNRMGEIEITHQYSDNLKGSFIKLLLFKAGEQPGPTSYTIQDKWSINSGRFHWSLPGPEGFELGSYQIRVQSLNYPDVYGDSGIITFTAKEHSVTAGYDAKISNHEKVYRHASNGMTQVAWDTGSCADPAGFIRIGFRNLIKDDNRINYVYRSFIRFDLKNIKGEVKWAKLSYIKNDGTPDANRPTFALTLPWNGNASDLFSIAGNPINLLDPPQMRALVQGWINDPNMNFGLVMTGPDESMMSNNAGHIMYLENVRLEIGLAVTD